MKINNEPPQDYDESFKSSALEFLRRSGGTIEVAAADLGIAPSFLRRWRLEESARQGHDFEKSAAGAPPLKRKTAAPPEPAGIRAHFNTLFAALYVAAVTAGGNGMM